jgi:hypothetical protein
LANASRPMLPEGFVWEHHPSRDMALKLDGKTVALLVALELGYGFRLDINPDSRSRRSVFMASKDRAKDYLEAWATKWELRLKKLPGA